MAGGITGMIQEEVREVNSDTFKHFPKVFRCRQVCIRWLMLSVPHGRGE